MAAPVYIGNWEMDEVTIVGEKIPKETPPPVPAQNEIKIQIVPILFSILAIFGIIYLYKKFK